MTTRAIPATSLAAAALTLWPAASPGATQALDAPSAATFTLQGPANGVTGSSIAQLGDVDGDGRSDAAVAAPFADLPGRPDAGIVRVLLGSALTRGAATFDSAAVPGFEIVGGRYFRAGFGVAGAGDLNGDGRADILLSAPRHGIAGYKTPARAYVVFGRAATTPVDLTRLGAAEGFEITGAAPYGYSSPDGIAGAGDLDRDGFDDIALSEAVYAKGARRYRGDTIVIWGRRSNRDVDTQRLGSRGFRITGARRTALAGAGDANGDRRDDLLIGAPSVKLPGRRFPANSAYVIFGRRHRATLDLRRLSRNGYRIGGLVPGTIHRPAVAGAGDLNGDRRDDALLVSHPGGSVGHRPRAVVVFGSGSTRTVDASWPGARGFRILGESATGRFSGLGSVAGLGDLNDDRRPDLGLGSWTQPGNGAYDHSAFVVFGRAATSTVSLDDLGSGGFRLTAARPAGPCGAQGLGAALAAGGDLDADARPDVLLGAPVLGDCAGQALLVPGG